MGVVSSTKNVVLLLVTHLRVVSLFHFQCVGTDGGQHNYNEMGNQSHDQVFVRVPVSQGEPVQSVGHFPILLLHKQVPFSET